VAKEKESEKFKKLGFLEREIKKFEEKIIRTEDLLVDKEITKGEYEAFRKRYSNHISEMKVEKLELLEQESKFDKHIKFGLSLLTDLDMYFDNAPVEIKQKIITLFFPSKLIFENGIYRTTKRNQVLELIYLISGTKESQYMRSADISAGWSRGAPPAGLEPATL
jgi:site-specific DNA recombinase